MTILSIPESLPGDFDRASYDARQAVVEAIFQRQALSRKNQPLEAGGFACFDFSAMIKHASDRRRARLLLLSLLTLPFATAGCHQEGADQAEAARREAEAFTAKKQRFSDRRAPTAGDADAAIDDAKPARFAEPKLAAPAAAPAPAESPEPAAVPPPEGTAGAEAAAGADRHSRFRDEAPAPVGAAPTRVLEMRLKALGARVADIHNAWKEQRGEDSESAVKQEAKKIAMGLDPLMREIERRALVSVHVRDLASQQDLYNHNEEALLNPASNQKMLTASAALDLLGAEYRFATSAWRATDAVYLVGEGDPSLSFERLEAMAQSLGHESNVGDVNRLIVDASAFSAEGFPPSFIQDDVGVAYTAPTGALSVNDNAVGVGVRATHPGQPVVVVLDPANRHVVVDSTAKTVAPGGADTISVRSAGSGTETRIEVRGSLPADAPPKYERRRILNPARFAGEAFAKALIEVTRNPQLTVEEGRKPANAHLLKSWSSAALVEVLQNAVEHSNNFAIEQVLRTLAWRMTGQPGSFADGTKVLEQYWATIGVNRDALVVDTGSGLSRTGRFSARGLSDLLSAAMMVQQPNSGLLAVLPVAGQSGTLKNRHLEARGRLRAKTGTLNDVSTLSGVLMNKDGKAELCFSIMLNPGEKSSMDVGERHRAEERIITVLLDHIDHRARRGGR
jgi:serine-type D-Ala-D-Ala carboxypeptidase/endopeptidase (penicillin-binding protein 4)